jgi:NitT/TauT family transport system ATP-binding protein
MPSAGASGALDVRIDAKVYRSADGGRVEAVRGLAFAVSGGDFACLIGPSGCGKSTTLRILLGLDADYDGQVTLPAPDARLGVMFQEPRLLAWRTVEENVRLTLPPALRDRPLDDLFGELELADARGRFPGELSLGMERRVALARALAVEPDLLILDEPLVSLDDQTAARLRRLISQAASRRRVTTLMVTHNVREALDLADRLILLAPRPTRVIGEVPIETPRGARDAAWVESTRDSLARRFPGTIGE